MKCDLCKKPASVHLTDVSNNAKKQLHLCEECAQGQGVTIKSYLNKDPQGAVPALASLSAPEATEEGGAESDLKCPNCGITYRAFRNAGKFGCPHDYTVFRAPLRGLVEKIHGSTEHQGKVPSRTGEVLARQRELQALRKDLEEAVRSEAYELAAEIRDRINELEVACED